MSIDEERARRRWGEGVVFLAGFALCIPAANWLVSNIGVACTSGGPCLLPVAPGVLARSGVLRVGLPLALRDLVRRRLGVAWAVGAILSGPALSAVFAPPPLVFAWHSCFPRWSTLQSTRRYSGAGWCSR